jgi:hypothetical protein
MRAALVVLVALLCNCRLLADAGFSMNSDLDLSSSQISGLIGKAKSRDNAAAYRLFLCYDLARSDRKDGDIWLCEAARLHNTNAEEILAEEIKEDNHALAGFGKQLARRSMLFSAKRVRVMARPATNWLVRSSPVISAP